MDIRIDDQPADDFIVLKGRPSLAKFIRYIRDNAIGGLWTNDGELAGEWREARTVIQQLEVSERGWADSPGIEPLPEGMTRLAEIGLQQPSVQRLKFFAPRRWCLVEIDKVVVFQRSINLRYVDEIKASLPAKPTHEDIIRTAVGNIDQRRPAVRAYKATDTSYSFSSASNDLRFLDVVNLDPRSIHDYQPSGCASNALVIFVGFSDNLISAVRAGNRIILTNGSHRAFALRDLGIKHVPCLLAEATREEEFDIVLPGDVKEDREQYLRTPRPPVFKDYFDDRIRKIVPVARVNRVLEAQLNLEKSSIPAL